MNKHILKVSSSISNNIINIPGTRMNRKIVVIESDDWGSIRMPSKEVYEKFKSKGYDLAKSDYNRLDSLETNEDLEMLFRVLLSHTSRSGDHPVVTANCIVGNPDFKKIKASDFTRYYYEPVTRTLQRYPGREKVEHLWKEGNSMGIFHPQFHGREHVNIVRWMNHLRKKSPEILYTFANNTTFSGEGDYNFMEVLDYNSTDDLDIMKTSLEEGLDLFEEIFGYKSRSFIPPCYTWSNAIEDVLHRKGVKYIQGLIVQSVPTGTFGIYKKKYHYLGKKNRLGQRYLIRNCFFEPSLNNITDPVGTCLKRIKIAFKWHKPAIISTHRINFMGSLDNHNRSKNLQLLDNLLSQIIKIWPEVEFYSSDKLGDLISDFDDGEVSKKTA